jgi:phosphatidate phosphatase LPIN
MRSFLKSRLCFPKAKTWRFAFKGSTLDCSENGRLTGSRIFPWRVAFPSIMSALLFNQPLEVSALKQLAEQEVKRQDNKKAWMSWLYPSRWRRASVPPEGLSFLSDDEQSPSRSLTQQDLISEATSRADLTKSAPVSPLPSPLNTPKSPALNTAKSPPPADKKSQTKVAEKPVAAKEPPKKDQTFRKSLRPTFEQLQAMKLNPGANSITFSVNTELRGRQTLVATVYLWDHDSKLVISDIDGTITRSDALGHVLPMLGRDWSHSGVAKLFSSIRENGYHIVYLTSRAIGQAQTTRNFINNLRQEGDSYLPKGPVFMSPDRLFWAFNREIIRRKPEEFKIACLQDIARTFPKGTNPFDSGYGNRVTDLVAYQAAGVPPGRVFIINPSGTITTLNKTYKKTYDNMAQMVNEMYPPTQEYKKGVNSDYNDWNFWKVPLPELEELK